MSVLGPYEDQWLAEMKKKNEQLYHEIQRRQDAEKQLLDISRQLENANRAKSDCLSKMSHELRTPLHVILGFVQLMMADQKEELPVKQKKRANEILKSGQYLLSLINEILDLSRIESGKLNLTLEKLNLYDQIVDCLVMIRNQAAERELKVVSQLDSRKNIYIRADRIRIQQIMLNLLTNAIKYNKWGGKILISGSCNREEVMIQIQDEGSGIPKDELEDIFTPFYRSKKVPADTEGHGIGLSIVKQLVKLLGGKCGVESVEGEGSSFWVSFPIEEVETK